MFAYVIVNGMIGHCTGGRKKGRGPLRGHSVAFKRIKSGCQKLPIQFSSRLGGPVGANYRSFVDEVVMFTRKKTPLIGVRSWKDVHKDVKEAILTDLKVSPLLCSSYIYLLNTIDFTSPVCFLV